MRNPIKNIAEGNATKLDFKRSSFTSVGDSSDLCGHQIRRHYAKLKDKIYYCIKHNEFYKHTEYGMQSCGCKQKITDAHGIFSQGEFDAEVKKLKKLQAKTPK